ncbi:MAG: IS4 family transposase [Gammaproteobacteria bacterium]|nr:IS4 family transposase [Gammaproteobacteria bacterium]
MYEGKLVFSQLMDHAPQHLFRKCVREHGGNRYVKSFPCWSQFLCMAFAQLSCRTSLRDIEVSLRAHGRKLHHMGLRGGVSRNTLANANRRRDWRIYAAFAQELIAIARPLHAGEPLGLELDNTVYALDSSTIDLCLSVFPWALFRTTKSAVKLHALLDLRGSIPAFIHVSHAKMGDVKALDLLVPEPGAFHVVDRAYLDFTRLNAVHSMGAFFVIRAKSNTKFRRRYSRPVDKSTGLLCDQTVVLTGVKTKDNYPQPLRRVRYRDPETGRTFNFLTNNFAVSVLTVAELYRCRWQVELFFKWIKQHLRIKSFLGTSENAVKTQIWTAIAVYVLVAILRKRLGLSASLYTIMQALSLTLFEKTPISQLLTEATEADGSEEDMRNPNQLNLFDFSLGH